VTNPNVLPIFFESSENSEREYQNIICMNSAQISSISFKNMAALISQNYASRD
jgi:hypothetical protein